MELLCEDFLENISEQADMSGIKLLWSLYTVGS